MDFNSFDGFEDLLYMLAEEELPDKKAASLISPAVYTKGTTRKNDNVIEWGAWAAVDVDDHVFKGDLETELKDRFGEYYFVCYSTASSRADHPKFRLIFPLTARVNDRNIKKFWFALNTEIGSIGDRQTKDLSRMYYIPGTYAGADNFIFTNKGEYIDPFVLIKKHPAPPEKASSFIDRLPPEMKKQVLEHRKAQLTRDTSVTWTGYNDCPFVSKDMISKYKATTDNWYYGLYQIMSSIAFRAIKRGYPITAVEIETLCRELDQDTGNWYKNRPMNKEAENALEFAYKNSVL